MKIVFYSHTSKTHFHKKGFALRLVLRVKVFGTGKWLIPVACTALVKEGWALSGTLSDSSISFLISGSSESNSFTYCLFG